MSKRYGNLDLRHGDCMDLMRAAPENAWDLAIVDPPYGMHRKMDGGDGAGRIMRKFKRDKPSWDEKPNTDYFSEVQRVSKNQIIWGGNNFIEHLSNTTGFIFWYKHQPVKNFADGELAWSSFQIPARCFDYRCYGNHGQDEGGRIHPTQKPVALYRWLLQNYAKPGDKILDTHLGSGSIAIACHYMGFDLTGTELDPDYYAAMMKRIDRETKQLEMF